MAKILTIIFLIMILVAIGLFILFVFGMVKSVNGTISVKDEACKTFLEYPYAEYSDGKCMTNSSYVSVYLNCEYSHKFFGGISKCVVLEEEQR